MLQRANEQQVHRLGGKECNNPDLNRGLDILTCIKAWRQNLHREDANQPHAIPNQRIARHKDVVCSKRAVLKEGSQQRHGNHAQRQGRGQSDHDYQAQAPVKQLGVLYRATI